MNLPFKLRSTLSLFCFGGALFLILLPELLRLIVIQTIPRIGLGDISIDDIDVNLFKGRIELKQVSLQQAELESIQLSDISIDLNWWQTLSNELTIEGVHIDGLNITITQNAQGQWLVLAPTDVNNTSQQAIDQTIDQTTASELLLPALTLQALSLNNSRIQVTSPSLQGLLAIKQIQLQKFSTVNEEPLALTIKAKWNEAMINVDLIGHINNQQQHLQGKIDIEDLQLNDFSALVDQRMSGLVGIDLTLDTNRSQQGVISSAMSGQLNIAQLNTHYKALSLLSDAVQWQGDVQLEITKEQFKYTANNQLTIKQLKLNDDKDELLLTRFEQFQLNDFSIDQNLSISASGLKLSKVHAMQSVGQTLGKFYNGVFELGEFSYSPSQGLVINTIDVHDAQYRASINSAGEFQINGLITTIVAALDDDDVDTYVPATETTKTEPDDTAAEPFIYSVKQFTLLGDNHILFEDQRFTPSYQQKLDLQKLTITGFDNGDPNSSFDMALQGQLGEFSDINVAGQVQAFGEQLGLSLKGHIEAIELPAISAYAEAYVGYQFTQGHFDHDFTMDIKSNHLTATNKLSLRQLELSTSETDATSSIEQQLNIPLDMALNVLRDSDNNIELDVPIDGQLDELGVGLGDIIGDALSNSLTAGATSYLKYALQPYGAVLMAAEYIGEQATSISLEPIDFDAGQTEPPVSAAEYSDKIVALLNDRPALNLSLCGLANKADHLALKTTNVVEATATQVEPSVDKTALLYLAGQRAKHLKSLFINKGISSKRLFVCKPSYKIGRAHV